MYTEQQVLELIELIYAAAGDPARWEQLLARLGEALGGSAGSLHSQYLNSQEAAVGAAWNIDPELLTQYVNHYSQVNPCFQLGKHLIREGAVNLRQALCPDPVFLDSEFYNDYVRRLNVFDGVAATVLEDGTLSANLTIYRPKNDRRMGQAECEILSALMPHLQRALQLHNRIQGLECKGAAAADALDQLSQGVILLDSQGRALLVNRAAAATLAGEAALRLTPRGLLAAVPAERKQLDNLIRGAVSRGQGKGFHSGGAVTISRMGGQLPLQLLVVPLRTSVLQLGSSLPVVAVFLSDPSRSPALDGAVLAQLYGLTRAEIRFARILASGVSLKEASQELGVAQSTLRSQLKSIFAKTDTNRQSQLVRLLLLTPARGPNA